MEQKQDSNLNLNSTAETQKKSDSSISSLINRIQSTDINRRRLLACLGFPMAWFFINYYLAAPRGFYQAGFWPLFLLLTFWYFKSELRYKDPIVILSALGVLAGSIHAAIYASEEMAALNFLMLPLLSVFCLITATRNHPEITIRSFLSTLDTLLFKPFMSVFLLVPFLSNPKSQNATQPVSNKRVIREITVGLLLAIPLVFFLLILLAKADSGFASIVDGFLGGIILNFRLTDLVGKIIISLIGLIYFLGVVIGIKLNQEQAAIRINAGTFQSATISVIILWSVNLLYFLFTLTQLQTLYFPGEALTAMDQGIAQYARSGFFSLLIVLFINLILMWYLTSFTNKSAKLGMTMKIGYLFLTLFTINLIVSSIYKMNLYEAAYGYTYLRLFVKFALIFFSLGLALMVLYMMKATREIIKPLTMLAIVMFIILSLLNLEGIIVTKAATIYRTSGKLDTSYMSELSADASPALFRSFDLDNTQDPLLLTFKTNYTEKLFHDLDSTNRKEHPLSLTITERLIKR